jgi:hypothetical protein
MTSGQRGEEELSRHRGGRRKWSKGGGGETEAEREGRGHTKGHSRADGAEKFIISGAAFPVQQVCVPVCANACANACVSVSTACKMNERQCVKQKGGLRWLAQSCGSHLDCGCLGADFLATHLDYI